MLGRQGSSVLAFTAGVLDRTAYVDTGDPSIGGEPFKLTDTFKKMASFGALPHSRRKHLCKFGRRGITEFNYRYGDDSNAHIFVGIQLTGGSRERDELLAKLRDAGFPVEDLSDNEMAKLHVRHMVGGRNLGTNDELLFRFEFPERPGALLDFLNGVGSDWNITLFHYRNHGAAYGRVLVGFAARGGDRRQLVSYLRRIGYRFWEENDNPAYRLFLK